MQNLFLKIKQLVKLQAATIYIYFNARIIPDGIGFLSIIRHPSYQAQKSERPPYLSLHLIAIRP